MPIKPENRARYPKHWKEIVEQVRERSGDKCEGSPDYPDCRRPNGWLLNKRTGELTDDGVIAEAWELADGDKVSRIVLTTAHLDHVPENCDLPNLRHKLSEWTPLCVANVPETNFGNTPPPEAVRMSEAEIDAIYREVWSTITHAKRLSAFARAVEQATAERLGVKMGDV